MIVLTYAAHIREVEPREFLVRFDAVPEAITAGSTEEEAIERAPEALSVALEAYLKLGRDLPEPDRATEDEVDVPLDPIVAARLLLARELKRRHAVVEDMTERLSCNERTARRMLSGRATFRQTVAALRELGVPTALAI